MEAYYFVEINTLCLVAVAFGGNGLCVQSSRAEVQLEQGDALSQPT